LVRKKNRDVFSSRGEKQDDPSRKKKDLTTVTRKKSLKKRTREGLENGRGDFLQRSGRQKTA